MAGEDEDAAALVARGQVVFQAVVAHDVSGDSGGGVAAHLSEFGEKPAQAAVLLFEQCPVLGFGASRKCNLEVAEAEAVETAEEWPDGEGKSDAQAPGSGSWKRAEQAEQEPESEVLHVVFCPDLPPRACVGASFHKSSLPRGQRSPSTWRGLCGCIASLT